MKYHIRSSTTPFDTKRAANLKARNEMCRNLITQSDVTGTDFFYIERNVS